MGEVKQSLADFDAMRNRMVDESCNTSGSNFYKPVEGMKNIDLSNNHNTRIVPLMTKDSQKNSVIIFGSAQGQNFSSPIRNEQNCACVGTTSPATLIKVKSLDSSDISDRDFNAAPRLTMGISTHYGLLNSPLNSPGYIQEEGNEGSSGCIDMENFNKEMPNILSSTSRDLKVSPFLQMQQTGKRVDRHVSNQEIIKIVNPSGGPGSPRNAAPSNMQYN